MDFSELNTRTTALIERLHDRLNPADYRWALENGGNAEWELAIATLRQLISQGRLELSEDEDRELAAIEKRLDRRWHADVMRTDWTSRQEP